MTVSMQQRDALTALCSLARWSFGATAVSVALVDDDGLVYVANDDATGTSIAGTRIRLGQGIAGLVAATGQSLSVRNLRGDPRFAIDVAQRTGYVPDAIQCVPFYDAEGNVVGVLSLLDRDDAAGARSDSGAAPSIEAFTALAGACCAPTGQPLPGLDRLTADDRARAESVIAAVIDALGR